MSKDKRRSERRHQLARIRHKYRRVALRWAGRWDSGTGRHKQSKEAYVALTAAHLANHHKCPCWMCKRERYCRMKHKQDPTD